MNAKQEIIALANRCGIDVDEDGDIMGSTNGSLLVFAVELLKHAQLALAASTPTLGEYAREPFMADPKLTEMWNESQDCAVPHISFGLLVVQETMRQIKERGVAPAVPQPQAAEPKGMTATLRSYFETIVKYLEADLPGLALNTAEKARALLAKGE